MPQRDPGPSVKDKEQIEALRDQGAKEKAPRCANSPGGRRRRRAAGGGTPPGVDRRGTARARAGEIGIEGRSEMSKDELISSLRNH